jgi:Transposase DDE domain
VGPPMWTNENRAKYKRDHLRYPSDLTDEEWRHVEPLIPPAIDPHGFDAGKKIKGKKRDFLVDTQGLLMQAIVHSADVQDRDGGLLLLATLFGRFPYLEKLFADSAYQGPIFADGLAKILSRLKIEIVKRSDQAAS